MDDKEQYIAYTIFKSKVVLADGNSFEQLFTELMVRRYSDFKQVKPQGQIGDKSCDGMSLAEGLYCQVYAPEDISKNDEESAKKFEHDFTNLLSYWEGEGFVIRKFRYVVNDKGKGVGPTTHARIQAERLKHLDIDIQLWTTSDIERFFSELSSESIMQIIGFVPIPSAAFCENAALNEVVSHLMTIEKPPLIPTLSINPDTERKIQFNHLNADIERFLNNGLIHAGQVEEFFNNNNFGQREILRDKFSGLYNEAMETVPDAENHPNEVFLYIYQKASPTPLKSPTQIAVQALMSYYFETCDIFKKPE